MESDRSLRRILEQSRRLRKLAADGEWLEAEKLEAERRGLIQSCFSAGVSFGDGLVAARRIQEIIDLDAEVLEMAAQARVSIGRALGRFQRGRQATRAYHKAGP
ncbi:MAG TPA: flagellar protein FliT [Sedimenticola sp.]|nr:flagellar protein FliT [Sedimenticola sp.]